MTIAVVKYVTRLGTRALRSPFRTFPRALAGEPCPPQEPCPPPKAAPCSPSLKTPESPPCPAMPQCPPSMCPKPADPNNPCNYCPPPCIDPHYPNITKLKKLQCWFQRDDDIPIFLKKGNSDALIYQVTIVSIIISLIGFFVSTYNAAK